MTDPIADMIVRKLYGDEPDDTVTVSRETLETITRMAECFRAWGLTEHEEQSLRKATEVLGL